MEIYYTSLKQAYTIIQKQITLPKNIMNKHILCA